MPSYSTFLLCQISYLKSPQSKDGETLMPPMKYTKDLFYITPLLHKELPYYLEKLIMLDIDLEFKYAA